MVYWCGVKQVHIYCKNRRTLTVWLVPITSHSDSSHYSHICRFICDSDANLQTTANQSETQRQMRKRCEATLQYFSRASHRLLSHMHSSTNNVWRSQKSYRTSANPARGNETRRSGNHFLFLESLQSHSNDSNTQNTHSAPYTPFTAQVSSPFAFP